MTSRQRLIRLLAWWLVAFALSAAYAGTSILLGGTSPRVDVAFGSLLILLLVRWTGRPDLWLIRKRDRWISWIYLMLAAWVAMQWLLPQFTKTAEDHFLFALLGSPRQLLGAVASEPALQLREAYLSGAAIPSGPLLQLTLVCALLGMAALATAGTLRGVWLSLQPRLAPLLDALHTRLPVRTGRWLARLRWVLIILLGSFAGGSVLTGWAAIANATIPPVEWQTVSAAPESQAVVYDDQDDTLYVVTANGDVLRTRNFGPAWQPTGNSLANIAVDSLAQDLQDQALHAHTDSGSFHSDDGGATWHATSPLSPTVSLIELLSARHGYGVVIMGQSPGSAPVWAIHGGGARWARLASDLDLYQAALLLSSETGDTVMRPDPTTSPLIPATDGDPQALAVAAWGGSLAVTSLPPQLRPLPLAWLALRAWVWSSGAVWPVRLVIPPALAALLALSLTYANLARPFGVPLWATLLARHQLDTYVQPAVLDSAWLGWEEIVQNELLRFGDATADDLLPVPGPFRRYALRRFAQTHSTTQALEVHPAHLRLLAGDRLRRWHTAWAIAAKSLSSQSDTEDQSTPSSYKSSSAPMTELGRMAVEDLAAVLSDALGLVLHQPRDLQAARAYLVEAPALRLRLPPRFPLIFLADRQPDPSTVQTLIHAVDALRESGYFALIVPLEPSIRHLDVAAELRQAVDRSPYLQDFIVLSQEDVLTILAARNPTLALVQRILTQVDLTVVSPFIISGPVPERVFFGREAEVKMLVESAGSADFAIVGNRKIGKTSLLQRARARMAAGRHISPLSVDCQIVRDEEGFFAAFRAQNRLASPVSTSEEFRRVLAEMRQAGTTPVLLMDEVDELLAYDRTRGESLAATWRALAQAGMCRFIFCGSTELARRLDDPGSAFFNFPQPLPLGYLTPETARLVLSQPMETLGIILEDAETLLDQVQVLTSGHPNLIQYLGRGLVEAANRRGERRVLLADLQTLQESTDFTEYYLKTVWGQSGPLERLITLLAPSDTFQIDEMETALLAQQGLRIGEEELDAALKLLRVYAVLDKRDRIYRFIPRAFRDILHRTQEVKRLIAIEKRRLSA